MEWLKGSWLRKSKGEGATSHKRGAPSPNLPPHHMLGMTPVWCTSLMRESKTLFQQMLATNSNGTRSSHKLLQYTSNINLNKSQTFMDELTMVTSWQHIIFIYHITHTIHGMVGVSSNKWSRHLSLKSFHHDVNMMKHSLLTLWLSLHIPCWLSNMFDMSPLNFGLCHFVAFLTLKWCLDSPLVKTISKWWPSHPKHMKSGS